MSDINSIGGLNPQINFPRLPVNKETTAADSKNAQITDDFSRGEADTKKLSQSILDKLCSEPSVDGTRMLGNTRILPDNFGRVKHLALQISDYVGGSMRREVLDAYKSLFLNMESDTKFTMVVGSDRDRKDVEKVIKDNNVPNPDRIQFIQPPLSHRVGQRPDDRHVFPER